MSHSEVQELLAAWRESLRDCNMAEPGSDAWSRAHAHAVDMSMQHRVAVLRMQAQLDQLEARGAETDRRLRGTHAVIEHASATTRRHSTVEERSGD